MTVYAESSAVLAWLLGEPQAAASRAALSEAERVVASELTLIECDRALHRAAALGIFSEATAAERRALLSTAGAGWQVIEVGPPIVERARRAFPVEPVRTLDAIHLASALVLRGAAADLVLLSLDRRVRDCARALGFALLPPEQAGG